MAAPERRQAAPASFCARVAESQSGCAGREVGAIIATGAGTRDRLADHIALQICKVANRADPTPDELFVAGVGFVLSANRSHFKKLLATALADWSRQR
jgi:hypothetical protein